MTMGAYLTLCIYSQIVVFLIGLPLILALVAGDWLIAAAAILVFLLLVIPPAMIAHARTLQLRER